MDNGLHGAVPPSRKKVADLPHRPPTVPPAPKRWDLDTGKEVDDGSLLSDDLFFHQSCGGPGVID